MTPLSAFGLFAVIAMLVTYALERRSPWFVLAFAGAFALESVYGFLQGAWPFGLVEGHLLEGRHPALVERALSEFASIVSSPIACLNWEGSIRAGI